VRNFSDANALADRQAQTQIDELGAAWGCLDGAMAGVATALGSTEGALGALCDDLSDFACNPDPIANVAIATAQINVALNGWTNLGAEAARLRRSAGPTGTHEQH